MKQQESVAVAIGLGYLLGRKRRFSTTVAIAAAAATCQFAKAPIARLLGVGSTGDGMSRLGEVGKAAARTALNKPLERIAGRLNESAEALRQATGKPSGAGGEQGGQQQPQGGQQQPQGGQQQPQGGQQQPQGGQQQPQAGQQPEGEQQREPVHQGSAG